MSGLSPGQQATNINMLNINGLIYIETLAQQLLCNNYQRTNGGSEKLK